MNVNNRNARRANAQPGNNNVARPNANVVQVNNAANAAVPVVANVVSSFYGQTANRVENHKSFGPQALKFLNDKFETLSRAKKLNLSRKNQHPHPYGAFAREFFDDMICDGLATNETILSVGTENRNQTQRRFYQGNQQLKHLTIHGMAPMIPGVDELRHRSWVQTLRQHDVANMQHGFDYHAMARNVCNTVAGAPGTPGLCHCVNLAGQEYASTSVVRAIDSANYDGVLQGMCYNAIRHPNQPMYFTMHDFRQPVDNQILKYYTVDQEGLVELFTRDGVWYSKVTFHGDQMPRVNKILNSAENSWCYRVPYQGGTRLFFCQEVDNFNFIEHKYRLIKMEIYPLGSPEPDVPIFDTFFKTSVEERSRKIRLLEIVHSITSKISRTAFAKPLASAVNTIQDLFSSDAIKCKNATAVVEWIEKYASVNGIYANATTLVEYHTVNDFLEVTMPVENSPGKFDTVTFQVVPEVFVEYMPQFVGRVGDADYHTIVRSALLLLCKTLTNRINPTSIMDTLSFARIVTIRCLTKQMLTIKNQEVDNYKNILAGTYSGEVDYTHWSTAILGICLRVPLRALILPLLFLFICYFNTPSTQLIVYGAKNLYLSYEHYFSLITMCIVITRFLQGRTTGVSVVRNLVFLFVCWYLISPVYAMHKKEEISKLTGTGVIAMAYIMRKAIPTKKKNALYYSANQPVAKVEKRETVVKRHKSVMKKILNGTFKIFLLCVLFERIPIATAYKTKQIPTEESVCVFLCIYLFLLISRAFMVLSKETIIDKEQRLWIKGSCVFDDERLNFSTLPDEVKRKIRVKRVGYKTLNFNVEMTPAQIRQSVGCKCGDKPYAGQIGPIIRGPVLRLPTIKHPCHLNALAALKRGLEAVVEPHPDYLIKLERTFRRIGDQIISYLYLMTPWVDHEVWLAHHPIKYREKILKSASDPHNFRRYDYNIFPKVEMQITTVAPEMSFTAKNDLKERCIYGPSDYKKLITGPFMHLLEKVLHKYDKVYCGMKNWSQICETLQEMEEKFKRKGIQPIFVEADFSRYDSTQKRPILVLLHNMFKRVSLTTILIWSNLLCVTTLHLFLDNSLELKLVVMGGFIVAYICSRASGDTWTTVGNTITSKALWSVVLECENFNPDLDGFRENFKPVFMMMKGDDMIGMINPCDLDAFVKAVTNGFNKDNTPKPHGVGCIVKVVEYGDIEQRSYLSARFFRRTGGGLRMVRKPERVFMTNPFSTKIQPGMKALDYTARQLLYAKGQCMLAWGEGLPIFDTLARKMIELGVVCDFPKEYADKERICDDVRAQDYDDCARWLMENYDLASDEIEEIEQRIRDITSVGTEVVINSLVKLGV